MTCRDPKEHLLCSGLNNCVVLLSGIILIQAFPKVAENYAERKGVAMVHEKSCTLTLCPSNSCVEYNCLLSKASPLFYSTKQSGWMHFPEA